MDSRMDDLKTQYPPLVVASCAAYADAWIPFSRLFHKFWPDFKGSKILVSDAAGVEMPDFQQLTLPRDEGWIGNLSNALEMIESDSIILSQEDFFLTNPALDQTVLDINSWLLMSGYDAARLYPCPGAKGRVISSRLAVIDADEPYRCSCQMAIWRRTSLQKITDGLVLEGKRTAADFELFGGVYTAGMKLAGWREEGHPSTWPVSYLCSAITRGRWSQLALKLCRDNGIDLSGSSREIEPPSIIT
jgi:hypothetical protein